MGAQPMAHEPPRLILAFWVAHFNICKFHALFGANFMHSIHACTMYIKCMYSVYKFIVLCACIVHMCVELSSCRLANLNFPKCLQKFAKCLKCLQNSRAPYMTRNCLNIFSATRVISHNDFALEFLPTLIHE